MKIQEAKSENVAAIMEIIEEARQIMRKTGNLTQWTNGYPNMDIILRDVALNQAYICMESDEIVGYFVFF